MKREEIKEILKDLNPSNDVIDKIMAINGADINAIKGVMNDNVKELQTQLASRDKDIEDLKKANESNTELSKKFEELQSKYDTETAAFKSQLESRDYKEAIRNAISDNKIKFTSKSAERYFYSEAENKKMKLENGKLTGFDEFYKAQKEADSTAFVTEETSSQSGSNSTDKGGTRFLDGTGNTNGTTASLGAQMAARFNSQFAKTAQGNTTTNKTS